MMWPALLLQSGFVVTLPTEARAQVPPVDRVFIIAMENAEYGDVVGNPSAPYLNSLLTQYGVAANYTAVTHPSLPNYVAVTSGDTFITVDCDSCVVDVRTSPIQSRHQGGRGRPTWRE